MKTEVLKHKELKYIKVLPENYKEGEKYPVIFFLHGAGTRGTDIEALLNNPYFKLTENHEAFPFVTIAPQCPKETWFDVFEQVKELAQKVSKEPFADSAKIYAMGASMGGYATWQIAISMPEIFAAIVPICGGGMYWDAARLKNVPVRAFHGAKDDVVLCEESEKMVNAVIRAGGDARLTLYPENGHDAWSDTYSDYSVFEWLLSNTNKNAEILENIYNDGKIYG